MQKAQASVEFMVLLSFFLVIFVFSLSVASGQHDVFMQSKKTQEAKLLARTLASEINAVYLGGNGTEKTIFIKNFGDYNIVIYNKKVFVEWDGQYVSELLLPSNILSPQMIQGKEYKIKNTGGGILIETKS
ncbi:MAG: hypothetical protein QXM75_01595 [Candidatus Diapherotrites archaeon]